MKQIITKKSSLLRSTSLVSVMTFLSRILGFARDMVLAHNFGAGASMDAFFVAFRIPNFMRRLFAEGAFAQAFVPVLAEYQQNKTDADVRQFIARVLGQLSAVLTIVTVLGVLLAPLVIAVFAPGFGLDSLRGSLATEMLRLTFPYLMLISLTAMAGAILNTYGYFGVPAITPALLNICMIAAVFYLCPYFSHPVVGVALGVLIAGVAQLLLQLPFLIKKNLLVKPQLVLHDAGVRQVLRLMVPALFGVSVAQLNLMVDSIFASFLKVGSVSWLYYTDRLTDFPLGVFGVAISTVILPYLSRRHADNMHAKYSKTLDWGLRLVILIGVPAATGLVFFAEPLIASCFGYGKFSSYDLVQTEKSLITLGLGVPAFMLVKVLASGFYAQQNIKTPVKVGALVMLLNSILCAILIYPLQHAGLALASSLAGYINAGILFALLLKRKIFSPSPGWIKYLLKVFCANVAMGSYLLWGAGASERWMHFMVSQRMFFLLLHVILAVIIYVGVLGLSGIRFAQFKGQVSGG
ncbi:MAG: murein biosynthesis integral membrane protein MurJ [Legionellales bacterium RIFCSPHIGHO2_12_FULL_37_14]|nr:MAG: murein biosynthesis integral membrane protein MurJ [Legionellales bacterium RIFCSPHIGHO2_12_FULL_37_14]